MGHPTGTNFCFQVPFNDPIALSSGVELDLVELKAGLVVVEELVSSGVSVDVVRVDTGTLEPQALAPMATARAMAITTAHRRLAESCHDLKDTTLIEFCSRHQGPVRPPITACLLPSASSRV